MAYTTYLNLCKQLRREVGIAGTGPSTVSGQAGQLAKVVEYIADANDEINNMFFNWHFLWSQFQTTLVVGSDDPTVTKPTDIGEYNLDSFWLDYSTNSAQQLEFIDYEDYRDNYRIGVRSNAKPGGFTIQPDYTIKLDVPSDSAYTLDADYFKAPTRLASDGDTPDMPLRFRRVIVLRAKILYANSEQASELLPGAHAEYDEWMAALMSSQLPRQRDNRMMGDNELLRVVPE